MHNGNLQKIRNGVRTFGITPHIPGGFVSADTLEKIAKVSREYNGVIKITSGQRILITNLKEEDLPIIWDKLGMKPAVVTANSVKNVEICPAAFCKRSKYNTTPMGMKLSKKYSQMEMPCRTKIGVAGCLNACGSVYARDVGIIADKAGIIIVAGGSSGYNPRIADVIAKELDEPTAMFLIDSIFNYYRETAELGEKLSFLIERVGIDTFKKEVLKRANLI